MKHIVIIAVMSIIMTDTFAAIKIDGDLSEPEWKNAQKFTFQAGDPSFEVTALVLWDDTYFYFGCTMPDPTVEGKHESGIQPVWEDNGIEFYLETDKAKFEGRSENSFQLLFSAAGAYNDTSGKGQGGNADYDFDWDSRIEYVVALEPGTTLNDDSDQDQGWRVEARLPWSDMSVDGKTVRGKTMGWNVIYVNRDGGTSTAFSWSPDVNFANNHIASNWGEITYVEGDVSAVSGNPADLGQTVNGFQDDFTGETRDPNWKVVGADTDLYSQADGLLRVSVRTGDPNHLLYSAPGYSTNVQEVLARIRAVAFGTADGSRAGIGVGIGTNSQGINLHFRSSSDGTVTGRHFNLLDDARAWGPGYKLDWQTNVWYWLRLRQQNDSGGGTNDVFGKVWLADGSTPEPGVWQMTWNYIPARTERAGLAGITGSSIDGLGNFEVDYILIKAEGLPSIKVDFAPQGPAPTAPRFTKISKTAATQVTMEWVGAGTLESTANVVAGPWAAVSSAASPYKVTVPASADPKYFRLKQ